MKTKRFFLLRRRESVYCVVKIGGSYCSDFVCNNLRVLFCVYLLCVIYTDILVLKKIYHFDIILIYLI